ncbi:MAG: excinuclease ABC subunit UvrA [Myxococcales bacterium]
MILPREIQIENARSNNLRGVHCAIPLGALTVITGPSGSGKSTLAFDTLYAEGQRRYVSSLSAYARQFLERLARPEVDHISNLPPAIAIEQHNSVTSSRSTVGSASEVVDQLRHLFARIGQTICPDCEKVVGAGGIMATADRIATEYAGQAVSVVAPIRGGVGRAGPIRDELVRDGHTRLLEADAEILDLLESTPRTKPSKSKPWWLLIDRLSLVGRAEDREVQRTRIIEAVSLAFARGAGEVLVCPKGVQPAESSSYREGRVCDGCGRRFPDPSPGLFSFNHPVGACATCEGFGRIPEIDWNRVVPDPSRSLNDDAIAPFGTKTSRRMKNRLLEACEVVGIDADRPFTELTSSQRDFVFEGDGENWNGVRAFFDWLAGRRYKIQARVLIARHRRYDRCPDCDGTRLSEESRAVQIEGQSIADIGRKSIAETLRWVDDLISRGVGGESLVRLMDRLQTRLRTIHAVGLGYLNLDRTVRTLSGGEAQRIQLATALGGNLCATLYVLDEPSIGLHAADLARLLRVLQAIRDQGNTVVVVEHATQLIEAADHIIDLGPDAGSRGGEVVAAGSVAEIRGTKDSKTGAALRGELGERKSVLRSLADEPRLRIIGANANNLRDLDVEIPLHGLVAITGVSGAGKSTLIRDVLVPALAPIASLDASSSPWRDVKGKEWIDQVVVVDQSPASRSARSNPATITKAFDAIRQRFAATREAKARGWSPGKFSFNVVGGRCDECEGAGVVVIDMQFLDDLRVPCDTCAGRRYRREVLDIRIDGRSITDVLELGLEEACQVFAEDAKIVSRLSPLVRVGLGYLRLGQPLSTLSGGENQRLRLGQALVEGANRTLYVFDEPTTGLHPADTHVLLECFDQVIEAGASVIVVEHDLDVIARADWVIDLGPGGGPGGGRIVAEGSPAAVAAVSGSLTGKFLAESMEHRILLS